MTFDALAKSEHSAQPLELYKFANATNTWRYTSSTETTTYSSEDYLPEEIVREKIAQTTNLDHADMVLNLPRTASLVRDYLARIPPTPYWLTLFRLHHGDAEVKQLWQGRVITINLEGMLAQVRLESIITAQNRQGLQRGYHTLCNHFLYDGVGCPVLKLNHARAATVTAIGSGLTRDQITVSGLSAYIDEWFEGGFVELADGDARDIVKWTQSTGVAILDRSFASTSLLAGDPVTFYDGCKHRWIEDCVAKFGSETNNGETFGGYPFPGSRNPFKQGVQ